MKPAFPVGLIANWSDYAPTFASGSSTVGKGQVKAGPASLPLGGLTDLDLEAVAPTKAKGNRQVVEILTDSESDGASTPIKPAAASKKNPKKETERFAVKLEHTASGPIPRLDLTQLGKAVKAAPIKLHLSTPSISSTGNSVSHSSGGGSTSVPAFVQARWVSDFLPTLYHALGGIKGNSWDLPGGDVDFIQDVFDHVYIGSGYQVTLGCPVFLKAKDRLNEKRSFFGKRGVVVVDALFQSKEFVGDTKKIARYARWALRDDGVGIWGTPAPQGVKQSEPGYTKPEDVFTSDHVIATYAPFVKAATGTVHDYGNTGAALALALTGLERGWMKYLTGTKIDDSSQFSREHVGTLVDDYYTSVSKLSERRWGLILAKCQAYNAQDTPVPVSASTMEANRHQLFIPSSP
ncbi:hypothetical protein K438DRAFT_1819271 [Mycena galopus ATCC 62051]|nr:hypothetical protein K438DRAFT_1822111 [Mycena galopus ATCC 62051]KAF8204185.1 hypothetical protein K438DRAFT_1819271 [Mycena galopus ATCC 62051]